MATRLALTVSSEEDAGRTKVFELEDDFETVLEGIVPTQQPASSLEQRKLLIRRKVDGGRLLVPPPNVAWVEEIVDDE